MISLILLKLLTFSQILQGVHKLLHATVYIYIVTSVPSTHQRCPGDEHESPAPDRHGRISHTWSSFTHG